MLSIEGGANVESMEPKSDIPMPERDRATLEEVTN